MGKIRKEEILVGLDIGTSKVCAVVGESTPEGEIDIIGVGTAPSKGVRKGVVIDIDGTIESIQNAVEEAELMAGCSIHEVYTNISGGHIRGNNSSGMVALKEREVREADVQKVLDGARAIPLPSDCQILHLLPQQFLIDDQDGISKPLGMRGVRLEAKIHLVTASMSSVQNITKCVRQSGLQSSLMVFDAIASCEAILNEDEKELGVVLVDIGAGTTDVAILESGSIVHTAVLPIGGDHITNDIAVGFRTPIPEAERLKIKYGCAKTSLVRHDETIQVPVVGGRRPKELSRQLLAEIIEPRVEELFQLIQQEIRSSGYEDLLASGLVLTGGCTNLDGICEFAEEVTGLPVRRGFPQGIGGLVDVVRSPSYATGIGLLLHGMRRQHDPLVRSPSTMSFGRRWRRLRGWLADFF
ncbi:MAG: cell division protein FtsA [Deltaproteobacteria bacterium]|nr:cell division protein FtsA [Deltaproteobacteria bacterium]MBU50101.1 cell division protein FtsA [Deltaproteobacteria bacterium]|tara:strand:- start:12076 stop:13311 length:1236 start_codon:yes stop_codon:yes gene_type:complete